MIRDLARRPAVLWLAMAAVGASMALLTTALLGRGPDAGTAGQSATPTQRASPSATLVPTPLPTWHGDTLDALLTHPVPTPQPDDAQRRLIGAGGEFAVSMPGGFSAVVPPRWRAGTSGPDGDREALRNARVSFPEATDAIDHALEQLDLGQVHLAALTLSEDETSPGSGAINVWRWARVGRESIDQLADILVERSEPTDDLVREPVDLPMGPSVRLAWRYVTPQGQAGRAVSYVVMTPRGGYGIELRAHGEDADDAVARLDEFAASVRMLPGPRRDFAPIATSLRSVVIVIDAPATIEPDQLRDQAAATIALMEGLGAYSEVGVIAASDTPQVVVPFGAWTPDRLDGAARAVASIRPRGSADLVPGLRMAIDTIDGTGFGGGAVVLMSMGDAAAQADAGAAIEDLAAELDEAGGVLHAVAIGPGPHEEIFQRISMGTFNGTYSYAANSGDLGFLPARLLTLQPGNSAEGVDAGQLVATGETLVVETTIGPGADAARFDVGAGDHPAALVLVDPTGRQISESTTDGDVRIVRGHRRAWISILDPAAGQWTMRIDAPEADDPVTYAVIEQGSPVRMISGVNNLADEPVVTIGHPVAVAAGLSHSDVDFQDFDVIDAWQAGGTVSLTRPDGTVITAPLADMGARYAGISSDRVVAPDLLVGTGLPGSYQLMLRVRFLGPDGVVFQRAAMASVYYGPSPDRDDDGFPDEAASAWGLDRPDSSGAAGDDDNDGLSLAAEVLTHGTSPWAWDSDSGGEPDGSEVDSGRDPLDPADDRPAESCVPEDARPWDVTSSESPAPVPELEALIPDEVDGRKLQKGSMAGLPRAYGFFNYFWDALLLCAGGEPDELAHAVGMTELSRSDEGFGSSSLFVVWAIRIDGITGADLAAMHVREAVRQSEGQLRPEEREVDGRAYTLLSSGAVYAHQDVMFWMVNMSFLDSGLYVDAQVDLDLVEATVAQLPEQR